MSKYVNDKMQIMKAINQKTVRGSYKCLIKFWLATFY